MKKKDAKLETPDVPMVDNLGREARYAKVTQKSVEKALIDARGDILLASKILRLSLREFDNVLRAIPGIDALLGQIEEVKADNPAYAKMSGEWFERQCVRAISLYRLAALESLYELATMEMTDKAAMMNVKREAAVNLWGGDKGGTGGVAGELTEFFKSLNDDYQQRKSGVTRVRAMIEIQTGAPPAAEEVPLQTLLPPLAEPEPSSGQHRKP